MKAKIQEPTTKQGNVQTIHLKKERPVLRSVTPPPSYHTPLN